jgi:hypothetical protein
VWETGDRRRHATHPARVKPELVATKPNQVWSWDITKLHGPAKWTYYYLYVILDVYSRYVVGWMVAHGEAASLAERLLADTIAAQQVDDGQLAVHADRGTSMTSKPVALLLADLGVTRSHSRPHVPDDNPYSESQSSNSSSPANCSVSSAIRARNASARPRAAASRASSSAINEPNVVPFRHRTLRDGHPLTQPNQQLPSSTGPCERTTPTSVGLTLAWSRSLAARYLGNTTVQPTSRPRATTANAASRADPWGGTRFLILQDRRIPGMCYLYVKLLDPYRSARLGCPIRHASWEQVTP